MTKHFLQTLTIAASIATLFGIGEVKADCCSDIAKCLETEKAEYPKCKEEKDELAKLKCIKTVLNKFYDCVDPIISARKPTEEKK